MPANNDNILGEVSLGPGARFVFALSNRAGQQFAQVRKFVATARYTGPTPSGFNLTGDQLNQLVGLLQDLAGSVPAAGQTHVGVVARSASSEFRVQLVSADDGEPLPSVDIREHIDTTGYTGFTKKGIRFPWDKLPEVLRLFEVQLAALGIAVKNEPTMFPETQPKWVRQATGDKPVTTSSSHMDELLGAIPNFPEDFLPDACTVGEAVTLPSDTLELKIDRNGHWFVTALSGFHHAVRNEVEGKFILYAHQRGHTSVTLPTAMIHAFKTVAAYETQCRDTFHRVVHALELKSRNRQLAEFQTRQLFERHNLPLGS